MCVCVPVDVSNDLTDTDNILYNCYIRSPPKRHSSWCTTVRNASTAKMQIWKASVTLVQYLNAVKWFMSPIWSLEFWCGFLVFKKFVHPWCMVIYLKNIKYLWNCFTNSMLAAWLLLWPLCSSRATRWRSWLRHCTTSWKVAGSIPRGYWTFLTGLIIPAALCSWSLLNL